MSDGAHAGSSRYRAPTPRIEPVFDPAGPVLGIDPGVSRCGYGAVIRHQGRLRATACGVIRTSATDPLPERLLALDDELAALVAQVRPSALAVERVLFQANV